MKPPLLLTRPIADAHESKKAFSALGFEVISAPVMEINREAAPEILPDADCLILTSPHALDTHLLKKLSKSMRVYCVGERAANLCRTEGFTVAFSGPTSSHLIAALRKANRVPKHILYLSGRDVSSDITAALLPASFEVTRIITYRADAVKALSANVKRIIKQQSPWVVFYSKRSVELFVEKMNTEALRRAQKSLSVFCLSASIADRARTLGFATCFNAEIPSEASLLALLAAHSKSMV